MEWTKSPSIRLHVQQYIRSFGECPVRCNGFGYVNKSVASTVYHKLHLSLLNITHRQSTTNIIAIHLQRLYTYTPLFQEMGQENAIYGGRRQRAVGTRLRNDENDLLKRRTIYTFVIVS